MEASEICVFCNQPCEEAPSTTLTEKGCRGINRLVQQGKTVSAVYLGNRYTCNAGKNTVTQVKFPKPQMNLSRLVVLQQLKVTCSDQQRRCSLNLTLIAFFCGQQAINQAKRKSPKVISVRTIELKEKILAVCRQRGDSWGATVQARILPVHDLHAVDAVYHHICSNNFQTNKQNPAVHQTETSCVKKLKLGRPEQERTDAFLEVVSYIEENDDEQITISDLIRRMVDDLIESDYSEYGPQHMKMKLQELYGDRIESSLLKSMVCLMS